MLPDGSAATHNHRPTARTRYNARGARLLLHRLTARILFVHPNATASFAQGALSLDLSEYAVTHYPLRLATSRVTRFALSPSKPACNVSSSSLNMSIASPVCNSGSLENARELGLTAISSSPLPFMRRRSQSSASAASIGFFIGQASPIYSLHSSGHTPVWSEGMTHLFLFPACSASRRSLLGRLHSPPLVMPAKWKLEAMHELPLSSSRV